MNGSHNMTERQKKIQALIEIHFPSETHPYRVLLRCINRSLGRQIRILELGCGRTASELQNFKEESRQLIGIDVVEFMPQNKELMLVNADICNIPLLSESIDLAYSRSVMEHIEDIDKAYEEIYRVLRPGGRYIFLTPNFYDYASIISYITPNKLHPRIVKFVEGRNEHDTFPAFYKSNTKRRVRALAKKHEFIVDSIDYLGQYPSYFAFNPLLFRFASSYEKFLDRHPRLHFLKGWILCSLRKA